MLVTGNDEFRLALHGAFQDAVVGIVGNDRQAFFRMHHFREISYQSNCALGFGIVPQELFLEYPFDFFEYLGRGEIKNSFSPGQKNHFGWPGFGKVEGRDKNIGVDDHPKHWLVRHGVHPLPAEYPPRF